MAPPSRHDTYKQDMAKFQETLQTARNTALKDRKYQSSTTRATLLSEFSARNDGMSAYPWQIDVAEALLLGLDCTVVAGTGAGKTMPFVMPLFVESEKTVIIISPLNALEEDQVLVTCYKREYTIY